MNHPHENTCLGCRRPCALRAQSLSRRAVAAGAIAGGVAILSGAARQAFASPLTAQDTAMSTMPDKECMAQPAADSAARQVAIENFTFSPEILTVPIGTEVTWENKDDIPHTVTSNDKTTFASSLLDTGDTFSFTFSEAGTFDYFCSVHPMMTAKVIVEA